jgi:hypothetical protein
MPTISEANQWNIAEILANGKRFFMCYAIVEVLQLVPGSKIRRAGVSGKRKWAKHWEDSGSGFACDENFIRVYVKKTHVDKVQVLIDNHNKMYTDAHLTPTTNIGNLDIKTLCDLLYVIDGMHRTCTLREAHGRWIQLNSTSDPKESPFLHVRVMIYHPDVIPTMAVLAKASNDQKQMHVKEDGLERVTLTQQVLVSFHANRAPPKANELQKRATDSDIARYFMSQVGARRASAVNYHTQLVLMARALEGEPTAWITSMIERYETAETSRAEVGYLHTHNRTIIYTQSLPHHEISHSLD